MDFDHLVEYAGCLFFFVILDTRHSPNLFLESKSIHSTHCPKQDTNFKNRARLKNADRIRSYFLFQMKVYGNKLIFLLCYVKYANIT